VVIGLLTRSIRRIAVGKVQEFAFKRRENVILPRLKKIDLYLHIPFCKTLCPYCPYNRIKYDENLIDPYINAVLNEIEQYASKLGKIEVSSLYIGGGTPTTMIDGLGVIIESIRSKFRITGDICIETSPGDLTEDIAKKLKSFGVDLISLGVQSFDEECLKALGRNYDAAKARSAVNVAMSAGFKSVNIDLMFTLPGQNIDNVLEDAKEAVNLGVNQVTAYPLFTFPYSAVGKYRKMRGIKMPDIFKRRKMYQAIHNFFTQNGYHQISVWGFEKGSSPRYSSVTRDTYIGLGAGAGSRLPEVFFFNTFSVKDYIKTTLSGKLPIAISMDMTPKLQKYYWLYWRFYETCIDMQDLHKIYGENISIKILFKLMKLLGLTTQNQNRIELTEKGAFFIHLLQNYFMLDYINKVWTVAMGEPWPEKIAI
jgi:oxygen-independent coproporphyrinogen III oxidase